MLNKNVGLVFNSRPFSKNYEDKHLCQRLTQCSGSSDKTLYNFIQQLFYIVSLLLHRTVILDCISFSISNVKFYKLVIKFFVFLLIVCVNFLILIWIAWITTVDQDNIGFQSKVAFKIFNRTGEARAVLQTPSWLTGLV